MPDDAARRGVDREIERQVEPLSGGVGNAGDDPRALRGRRPSPNRRRRSWQARTRRRSRSARRRRRRECPAGRDVRRRPGRRTTRRSSRIVTRPEPAVVSPIRPLTVVANDVGGTAALVRIRAARNPAAPGWSPACPTGRPSRAGRGRSSTRRRSPAVPTSAAAAPAMRGLVSPPPATTRASTASETSATQPKPRSSSQPRRASLPVPNECRTATGHEAYASQWKARQSFGPTRARSRLVTTSASRRSNATVPSPSQIGRYGEMNGTKASTKPIGAKPSATVVTTCRATKTIESSVRLRCRSPTANLGQRRPCQRSAFRMPSSSGAGQQQQRDDAAAARQVPEDLRVACGEQGDAHAASASVSAGQPQTVDDRAVAGGQPGGQPAPGEPRRSAHGPG